MRTNPEQGTQNQYNILTSSDDALIPQIAVSLNAMARNLSHADIDFYLLHSGVSPENMQVLSTLCNGYGNIAFHEIRVFNPEGYDPLVQAGGWQRETYYPLCAHQLLPDTVERAMYPEAGDTLVVRDIAPYYTCDFDDNFLIVTVERYKGENGLTAPLCAEDIGNPAFFPGILKGLLSITAILRSGIYSTAPIISVLVIMTTMSESRIISRRFFILQASRLSRGRQNIRFFQSVLNQPEAKGES